MLIYKEQCEISQNPGSICLIRLINEISKYIFVFYVMDHGQFGSFDLQTRDLSEPFDRL